MEILYIEDLMALKLVRRARGGKPVADKRVSLVWHSEIGAYYMVGCDHMVFAAENCENAAFTIKLGGKNFYSPRWSNQQESVEKAWFLSRPKEAEEEAELYAPLLHQLEGAPLRASFSRG